MLQQILNDMWVDPELLAELDDSQKQTLFCKMREEQIRRWKIWDSSDPPKPTKVYKGVKNVNFLLDVRGEPWTWVMGEHKDDKSIDQILEEETREAARLLAEQEALSFKIKMEAELNEILELSKKQKEEIEEAEQKLASEEVYCSPDEIKLALKPKPVLPNSLKRDALQEIYFNKPHKVSQRVALWEKRLMDERTSEIYKNIQKKKMDAAKEAEEAENTQDQLWREQERKAKEAEFKMREVARRAREEFRKSMQDPDLTFSLPSKKDNTTNALKSRPLNREAIVEWFKTSEVNRRAGLEQNSDSVAPWFHGLITRQEAENLLLSQPAGSFLVRVSERIWGYAISYKDTDRCKHYLIDATNGHYQFLGANQVSHKTLGDLVLYYGMRPITALGGETLTHPCHRIKPLPPVFQGLSIRAR